MKKNIKKYKRPEETEKKINLLLGMIVTFFLILGVWCLNSPETPSQDQIITAGGQE